MHTYRYETHLHTAEASACAKTWASAYIRPYLRAGYSGIIVTDHFFSGNTNIPSTLRWKERVRRFASGYDSAKRAGDEEGLAVFFGFEACFGEDEYLVYGLSPEWLVEHPDIMEWDQSLLFEVVDSLGALMIQAHPFRERFYNRAIYLACETVHGVEVVNGANDLVFDQRARLYAQQHGLLMTSGTDMHDVTELGPNSRGMAFDYPLFSIDEFIAAVKEGAHYTLLEDPEHAHPPHPLQPGLAVHYRGRSAHCSHSMR